MAFTPAQLVTLKNAIAADPAVSGIPKLAPNGVANHDGAYDVAAYYRGTAAPAFWVWRTSVSRDELLNQASVDGTLFSWVGVGGYILRSVGEQNAFRELLATGNVNASLANVRQAFADIFSGAGAAAVSNRTHLNTVARRAATRLEKLFATGTGTTASPATLVVEGTDLTHVDVENAWIS